MEDKEFYDLMDENRIGIDSMDITENQKDHLYHMVDETIQRYEENKTSSLQSQENLMRLDKAWGELLKKLDETYSIGEKIKKNLSKLEKTALSLRIRQVREGQQPLNN